MNVERMICGRAGRALEWRDGEDGRKRRVWVTAEPENLQCCGFLTLTVGDMKPDPMFPLEDPQFVQVWDAAEASRRFNNLNRRVLPLLFSQAVIVTERHASGAIHFHIVGILRGRRDIRTGFDFTAVRGRDYRSASPALREIWGMLRDTLPGYGFGRAELTPIEKAGEAIAGYVSKYIEKNICNRRAEDKRKKLVRYLGWDGEQLKANGFSWGTKRASAWRMKSRAMAALVGIERREEMAEAFGPRWAFFVSRLWTRIDDRPLTFFTWGFLEREVARCEMMRLGPRWTRERLKQLDGEEVVVVRGEAFRFRDLNRKSPRNVEPGQAEFLAVAE